MISSPAELAPAALVADAAAYARDGFLILPEPVVSPALLQRAVAGMEAVRHGEYDTGRPCVGSNSLPAREENRGMAPGAGNDTDTLCKMELPQQANHALREVVSLEAIGRLAAEATGATWVQVWWTQLLGKPASGGTETGESTTNIGFHQDRNYWQGNWEEGSELLTAWVALSNVAEDGGPMRFVRRSNHWGLLGEEANNFHMHDLESQRQVCLSKAPKGSEWEEVAAVLPAGSLTLHDNYTLHGSGPNFSKTYRRSLAIHMRTNKSQPKGSGGLTEHLADIDGVNPVVFGRQAFLAEQRAREANGAGAKL